MAEGNPIRFSDLFDFNDNAGVKSAAELIVDLNTNYKTFIETIMGANWGNLTNQQKEIAESARQLVTEISKVNQSTKEGQASLMAYTETMAKHEVATKNVVESKRGLKAVEEMVTGSVKGLKAEYKSLQEQYEKLDPLNKQHAAQMKTLSMAAQDTKDKISSLTTAFKVTTDVIKTANNSYSALDAENKKLILSLKAMEGGMDTNNAAANQMREQIFKNTEALKQFDAQINVHNRNVGNYLRDIQEAQRLRKELEALAAAGQKDTEQFKNLTNSLGTLTTGMSTLTSAGGGLGGQLTYVTHQMNTLAAAGRIDGEEFQKLSILAKELQAEMKNVGSSINENINDKVKEGVKQVKELVIAFFVMNEVTDFFTGIKEEAEQAERSTVQLRNSLESIGKLDSFDKVTEKVMALKNEFKHLDDEDIADVFTKMIDYGKLTEEQMDALVRVTINYAAKTRTTIGDTTDVMLKGLEGNSKAMKLFGVNVGDAATEADRFNIIIGQLGPKVEGAAKAFDESDSGKIAKFKRAIGDLQEEIGGYLLPILGTLAGAMAVLPLGPITVALGLLTAAMLAQYTATQLTTEGTVLYNLVQKGKVMWDALATTAQVAYTQALVLFTGETKAATAAQLAFNAAEAANPLTAIIAVIAIGAAAIYTYSSSVKGSTKAVNAQAEADLKALRAKQMYNDVHLKATQAVSAEIAAVNTLVDTIKHHSNSLEDRNKALEKLVALNRDNLAGLTLQNIETEKGIEILDRYIKKLEQTAYAEALQSKLIELEKERVELKMTKPKEIEDYKPDTRGEDPALVAQERKMRKTMNKIGEDSYAAKQKAVDEKIKAILDEIRDNPNPETHNKSDYNPGASKDARQGMEQQLKDLEEFSKKREQIVAKWFEESKKTETDQINFENDKLNIAKDKYAAQLVILDKYYSGVGKLDKKQKEDRLKYNNDYTAAELKALEARNKIQKELDKIYEDVDKKLKENIEKLRRARAELNAIAEDLTDLSTKNKRDVDYASRVDPILAMFGLSSDNKAFEKQMRDYDDKVKKVQRARKKLQDEKDRESGRTDISLSERNANVGAIDVKLKSNDLDLEQINADKRVAIAEKEAKGKEAVWAKSYELGMTLANSYFESQKAGLQDQMNAVQAYGQFELNLAGNNATAKRKIEETTHAKMLHLKRRAAELEKQQALFSIALSTAQGIAKALADYMWPYDMIVAAIVGGLGIAQAAAVSSKSLPQYWTGRGMGKDEFAIVNDRGPELIEDNGQFRVAAGGKETVTHLKSSEKVHSHEQSLKIMSQKREDINHADNWMDNLLKGTGAYIQKEESDKQELRNIIARNVVTAYDYEQGMVRALNKTQKEVVINTPPAHVADRHTRQLVRNGL